MPVMYKINVLQELKKKGYTQNRMRVEKLIGTSYMTQLRYNELVSWKAIGILCQLLDCQPGDLLKYVPDDKVSDDDIGKQIPRKKEDDENE